MHVADKPAPFRPEPEEQRRAPQVIRFGPNTYLRFSGGQIHVEEALAHG